MKRADAGTRASADHAIQKLPAHMITFAISRNFPGSILSVFTANIE
jgi:hypothetical protein